MAEPHALERYQRPALYVGGAALALCAVGGFFQPDQFFRSYLFAFLFWAGIALGCMAVAMLHHVTGGAWGLVIRRPLESGMRTLPLVAILFLPIALGVGRIYEWAHPEAVAADPILRHKSLYLNVPFFLGRAAVYFGAWLVLAYFLNRWSLEQDTSGDRSIARRLQLLSSGGLVLYGLTVTFASIDWAMSLEPHWFSTMYGLLFIAGQGLSAFAFIVVVLVLIAGRSPLAQFVEAKHYHDLGKLMLAFVMFWAYVSFSQYLIIWAGNLPEEIPWYLRRLQGGWGWVGAALVVLHFALPFFLLLPASANRNPRILFGVAGLILFMRLVDVFWLTSPAFAQEGFHVHWMDLLTPVGVGGLWLAAFLWQLGKRPLLPVNDPEMQQALAHATH
ncbi:MAG: hypothetical protein M3542_11955 [Acidobacteriota bacterium]|nr:hypothetical protein [Acidobacteriota bacterium]MDQ5870960.1 hypothetical protein [Acidobacteriota bacterium]